METPGLSFIEAMTQCPTNYGRRNKFKQVLDQVEYLRSHSMLRQKFLQHEERGEPVPAGTIVVGEFVKRSRPVMGLQR